MTVPVGSLAAYLSVRGAAQARQDILSVQRGLAGAGEAASAAGGAMGRTEAGLSAVGRGSAVASSGANRLRAAQLGVVAATERWNAVLADENATIAQTATAQRGLILANERVTATTRTMAAAQAKAAEAQAATVTATREASVASGRFAQATGGTVKQLGLMFGGFELLKKGIDIAKEAASFQRDMLLIQTNANASAAEVANMTAAVLKLAPEVATSPDELAKALYHVEQNGLRGKDALEALTVGAQGAKIGMADVEDTTNTMTIALASGIKGMGNMQQAMGFMIATAGTGDMRLKDLNEALSGGILSVAKGFGGTMADVAAVLATLGDNGMRGADAATALRQTFMGFAQPAKGGEKALREVGLAMHDLRDDMEKHGLVHAMNDLEKHMQAAGVTGSKVGGFITEAFGRKAGAGISVLMGEIDRLNIKFDEGKKGAASFGKKWEDTTKTASYAFKKLGVEVDTAGISLVRGAMPAVTGVAQAIGVLLPAALHTAGEALHPFVAAWHGLEDILGPVFSGIGSAAGALAPLGPVLKDVGGAVLGMWVAFKGYQVARLAVTSILDAVGALYAKAGSALAGVSTAFQGTGTAAWAASQQVALAEAEQVAAADAAEAKFARAEAEKAAAVQGAADEIMAANAEEAAAATASANDYALAAERKAAASQAAAVKIGASAEASAGAVIAEGEAASIGWAGILGPLALVGVGVAVLVSMFHSSTAASKEAADAAKGYADALKSGSSAELTDSIVKQLSDNHVPETIERLNKALGHEGFDGAQFVTAIKSGGSALADLRTRLQGVIAAGTMMQSVAGGRGGGGLVEHLTPAAKAATKALADLNSQQMGLSAAAKTEIANYKQLGVVAEPVAKIAQQYHLGTAAVEQYAGMLGLAVTKEHNLADATPANIANIANMAHQFGNATETGSAFLTALDGFSKSAGTAADRAAMIGSTLKAANGDALTFASSMIGAASANRALTDAFQGDVDKIAGLKQQIADLYAAANSGSGGDSGVATARMTATAVAISNAKSRIAELNARIASGSLSASGLAAAHRSLASAQASLGVATARLSSEQGKLSKAQGGGAVDAKQLASLQRQLADAYKNSEKAAINLNTGAIDFSKGGAPALVGQLQSIQDAATKAAGALYQHELATKGGKQAADDAYQLYKNQTSGALEGEAKKLGITNKQADKLAKTYFGMPKDVKTLIEQEGANPVLDVLNKIGTFLALLTHTPWNIKVDADTVALDKKLKALADLEKTMPGGSNQAAGINRTRAILQGRESGGPVMAGVPYLVGEKRPEVFVPNVAGRIEPRVPMGHKTVNVYQTINNPLPEPASVSGPAGLRRAAMRLDGF